jgi:hypothetical protein
MLRIQLIYSFVSLTDIPGLHALTERIFMKFEAPCYLPEGVAEFLKYIEEF